MSRAVRPATPGKGSLLQSFRPARRERQRGFNYLWMLMTVALLGVGLAIAGESYSLAARRDRERELLFIGAQFREALRSYHQAQMRAGQREYPASLDALLADDRFAGVKRHLRRVYVDPMTGKSEWGLVRIAGRIVGVHSLSEQAPLKQANFDLADAAFEGSTRYSDWVFRHTPEPASAETLVPPPAEVPR